jgi:hypothetical protein
MNLKESFEIDNNSVDNLNLLLETAVGLVRNFLENTSMQKTLRALDSELSEKQIGKMSIKDILNFNSRIKSLF